MKTITVKPGQTLFDVAIEQYGTCEALGELLALNPSLRNDPSALSALGIDALSDGGFYLDAALPPGSAVEIDPESRLKRNSTLRELTEEVTTFDL